MVSFLNTDNIHCDSVTGHYPLPSSSIPMDVKIPVKSSSFDLMQMGALLGAHALIEQIKFI
ncbi:hypothetical protein [Hafnia sp.]|uniref:hypothetical protein n=1 Tax=Hafnia sp. TaxID=1873498 RepID=UPI002FCA6EB2